ncbi:hypothetical protein CAPTEDRAFT_219753 [Capitella teleta]|uniref:U3 small nucleolar RNA-associated protein 14 homolog A n=1 Tax=Capitella teleta TaxID=283909 RepID=R7UND5_CAPTE|nr:hypothetical protein CAPTEDRAFT_219753 [Capitella teleta]|eukprot:ELU04906.1 hypothetical protein CAPTEDRAFT_219753 [Capitella teleta]
MVMIRCCAVMEGDVCPVAMKREEVILLALAPEERVPHDRRSCSLGASHGKALAATLEEHQNPGQKQGATLSSDCGDMTKVILLSTMGAIEIQDDGEEFESLQPMAGSDDEGQSDDESHTKLMRAMQKISGKKRKGQVERTEPSTNVSEFVSTDSTVHIGQLISALKGESTHALVKKKLKRVSKKDNILDIPLPRHEQDKIKRKVAFDDTKTEVSVWEPIVQKNRIAEQTHFPLLKPDLKQYNDPKNVIKRYAPHTSLELEVENLLRGSQTEGLNEDKMLTADEEKALRAMSLEEAKERRDLLRKHRALLSYKEAKARYQKRIKSKKYHRIMKKEKQKKDDKELEHLHKTDPEAFLEKLDSVDKNRIKRLCLQERMSLKHRGASKFMQKQARFSKFDEEARQSVQDMLQKSRQLTQKENVDSDDDEEEGEMSVEVMEEEAQVTQSKSNPWMKSSVKTKVTFTKPVAVSEKSPKEMTEEDEEEKEEEDEDEEEVEEEEDEGEEVGEDNDEEEEKGEEKEEEKEEEEEEDDGSALTESVKRKQKYEDFEGDWTKAKEVKIKSDVKECVKEEVTVDPGKFMTLTGSLRGSRAPTVTEDPDQLEQRLTIAQAFASDDVLEEFEQEKKEIEDAEKPKDIDLTLPGWGSWGGENVKPKKHNKFLIKAPPAPRRRDSSLGNVIINEAKVQSIAKHQVNRLPPTFKNVPTFESSIRHPIGKTWNPETAFQNLVAPKVVTHHGQVIDPISKEATLRKKKKMDLEGQKSSGPKNKKRKKIY